MNAAQTSTYTEIYIYHWRFVKKTDQIGVIIKLAKYKHISSLKDMLTKIDIIRITKI